MALSSSSLIKSKLIRLNRYPFSGKIICGQCGGTFKRRIHSSGRHKIAWCCSTHIADIQKCSMIYIPEFDFEYAFVTMINKLIFGHEAVLKPLLQIKLVSNPFTLVSAGYYGIPVILAMIIIRQSLTRILLLPLSLNV
jgi:hypothetical protein